VEPWVHLDNDRIDRSLGNFPTRNVWDASGEELDFRLTIVQRVGF
jgi:hypothetical protein